VALFLSVDEGVGSESDLFLPGIFEEDTHFLYFIVFFLIEVELVVEELIYSSGIFLWGIDGGLESAFFHLFFIHFLSNLLKFVAYQLLPSPFVLLLCLEVLNFTTHLSIEELFEHPFGVFGAGGFGIGVRGIWVEGIILWECSARGAGCFNF
jgi:hypothetical protein